MSCQFSKDGKYFAHLASDGKLKIWDTSSSKLEQEYTPDFHLTSPCTCLHFVHLQSFEDKTPKIRKRKAITSQLQSYHIALGTTTGSFLLYSVLKAELEDSINSETSQAISCLTWKDGFELYAGAEQNILCWDIGKKAVKKKWKTRNERISSILKIPDTNNLLTASKSIKLWDIESKSVLSTFVGHSSDVVLMDYISSGKNNYFISASKSDRLLSCWNLNNGSKTAIANFMMEDVACNIVAVTDNDACTKLAAVTRSGVCHIYYHVLNGKASKPIKPNTTLNVVSDTDNHQDSTALVPIISSAFSDDFSIRLAYGISINVQFEIVIPNSYEKVQYIVRKDPSKYRTKQIKGSNVKTPITDEAQYFVPHTTEVLIKRKLNGASKEIPMEKRLENLTLNKSGETSAVPKGNNVAHLLMQGLHSKDNNILRSVLILNNHNEDIIKNTIKRLPIETIAPLIEELSLLIQGKTTFCDIGASWMKQILQIHSSLLVSNPELSNLLTTTLASIDNRLQLHTKMCKLKGRLDLIVSQINVVSKNDASDNEDALLMYNDKASSDSEMDGLELIDHSESDNVWTEESEDEVVDNENMSVDEDSS